MTDGPAAPPQARSGHPLGHDDRAPTPEPGLLELLEPWLPERRWFPVKGVSVRTVPWVSYALPAPPGLVTRAHLLRLVGEGVDLVIHVPVVTERVDEDAPPEPDDERPGIPAIGTFRGEDGALWRAFDGAVHPAFWRAALEASGWDIDPGTLEMTMLASGRPLAVEQSNSSVRLPDLAGGVMLKVMRAIAIGPNPDVTIPRALAAGGWAGVPRPVAWLTATWEPEDLPGATATVAHLAIAAELVGSARDGFDLACSYAAQEQSFTELAAELGRLVAQMHVALRDVMPLGPSLDIDWLIDDVVRRAAQAATRAPVLARSAAEIEHFYETARERLRGMPTRPLLQHVHGDLHLGQALYSRTDGWKILDFEGEPLRPVEERTRTDLVMRDVAGMLRSFDYASAVGGVHDARWVLDTRNAFVESYRRAAAFPEDQEAAAETLIRVLVLDKAVYEVVYESTNRPTWAWIPLEAVARLLSAGP